MATLVARLAGPLQAWGVDTRFRVVATHETPTWSGLLGLCRAAIGHGRHDDPAEVEWLRRLPMAVRVDQPGQIRLDYHTVNPLPEKYLRFDKISEPDLGLVPLGQPIRSRGGAARWMIRNKLPTLTTQRAYLHDAAFLWLIEGDPPALTGLAYALTHPRWALVLGRKSCPPASPLVLGIHSGGLEQTARAVPVLRTRRVSPPNREEILLVWLNGTLDTLPSGVTSRVVMDNPAGAHPQDGYIQHLHLTSRTTAPILTGPWHALLDWAGEQLSQPYGEATR